MDRNVQPPLVDVAVGLAAGLFANWATDLAQGPLRRATPGSARRREAQVSPGPSSSHVAAQRIAERLGRPLDEGRLRPVAKAVHHGLGMAWGPVYCLLRRYGGMRPLGAGPRPQRAQPGLPRCHPRPGLSRPPGLGRGRGAGRRSNIPPHRHGARPCRPACRAPPPRTTSRVRVNAAAGRGVGCVRRVPSPAGISRCVHSHPRRSDDREGIGPGAPLEAHAGGGALRLHQRVGHRGEAGLWLTRPHPATDAARA